MKLLNSMKADFLFAGLNLNRIIQKKKCQTMLHFMDVALKTRGIIYLNVETWLLFAPPYQNFWLRAYPWLKHRIEKGPFLNTKTIVNRKKLNERIEFIVLLKQKKLEQKKTKTNRQLTRTSQYERSALISSLHFLLET